ITVGFEVFSGLVTFLVGRPEGRWLFVIHSLAGLSLPLLILWKVHRVQARLQPARWSAAVLVSIVVLLLALGTVGTGVVWASWQLPLGYPNGLNWHVILGLILLLVLALHTWLR